MKHGRTRCFIIVGILALLCTMQPVRASSVTDVRAVANDPFTHVRLGESLKELYATQGEPWIVAYQSKIGYWTYSIDNDQAWLVVGVSGMMVHSVQFIAKAHQHSDLSDAAGIALGDQLKKVQASQLSTTLKDANGEKAVEIGGADGVKRFYGIAKKTGLIDRIGLTLDDTTLPTLIRWYAFTGWTPDRAVPSSLSGGTPAGEERYLHGLQGSGYVESFQCMGANAWEPIGRTRTSVGGARLDIVRARCGTSSYTRTFYFALTAQRPRAFDSDEYSQGLLAKAGVNDGRVLHALPLHGKRAMVGSITPQIWFTTPNGTRQLSGVMDVLFSFIYDPAHPPTTITFSYATDGSAPSLAMAHRADRAGKSIASVLSSFSVSCGFSLSSGSGSGKCATSLPSPTPPCPTISGDNGMSDIACYPATSDPKDQPHPSNGVQSSNGNAAGGAGYDVAFVTGGTAPMGDTPYGGGSGGQGPCPIYAVSGKEWYVGQDFALSGPFGMVFNHRYDSDFATYQADLGIGWRDTYGAYLDLTSLSDGGVVFYDANCNREYFGTVGPGTTVYDQFAGGSLTATASGGTITGFTVTTWDKRVLTFDASGRLSSLQDRIGNTQTITRDGSHRISTVADQLGRSLSFSYDGSNRIISISSTPSAVSVSLTYDSGTNCYTGDLCSVEESDGSTWSYQYYNPSTMSGNHLLYEVIDPNGHIVESDTYTQINLGNGDNHYRVTHQERDSGKNAYDYAYSLSGDVGTTTITNSTVGQTTTYTWDQALQQVLSVSGKLCECSGKSISYTYDLFGRLLTVSEGGIQTRSFAYGRDTIFTSPDGLTSYVSTAYPSITDAYEYNIKSMQGLSTRHTQYAYYSLGDVRSDLANTITEPSVDTLGNTVTTTLTYNTSGLLTSQARQGYVNGTSTTYTISNAYDSLGRITSVTGPRTDVTQQTTFSYYPDTDSDLARRGQLETISRYVSGSLNLTTTYASSSLSSPYNTYTIYGKPGSMVDPNGVITDLDYDALGRLTTSTLKGVTGDTADLVTTIAYDTVGRVTGITKPAGNGLSFGYDTVNNLTNTILLDASGNQHDQMLTAYDVISEPTSNSAQTCATPASSCASWTTKHSESYAYTLLGNPSTITYPTIGATTLSWDNKGNLLSSSTGDSSYAVTTGYQRDNAHNLTQMGLGSLQFAASLYTHDLQGNQSSITERLSSSATTAYYHDDFGQIRKAVSPYTGTWTYQHDAAGNLTSYTDANGATTATTYDPLNRPLSAVSTKSGATTETVTWSYDDATSGTYRLGRLYQTTDPTGSKTYTYDRRGNVTTCAQVANGTTYTTSYGYDANGNRTSMILPSGRALTYTFDYADRPYSVSGSYSGTPTTYVSSTTYYPFGPRATTSFGNGTTQTFTYDQRYLPTENKLINGSGTLSDLSYTTNAVGFVTQITDNLNAAYDMTYLYGGNATNMMTDVNTGSALWGKAHYADAYAQNVTLSLLPGSSARTFKLSQRTGQMQSVFAPFTGTTSTITYDADGNETAVGSASIYTYSSRNLLATGDGITYTYDGAGWRVSETTTISGSAKTETSLYGPGRHLEMQTNLTSGTVAYDYIWLGDIPVAEEDIAGSNTYWTVVDHLGSPIILTNASAAIAWQVYYRPFGKIYLERSGGSIHQPLRFPGQEDELFDGSNGVNGFTNRSYNGARWYRSQFARYTQPDPIGYAGSPYNLYAYAENNPTNFTDSLGLDVFVSFHPVDGDAGHAYIFVTPTQGSNLTGATTISGEPSAFPFFGSQLISSPGADVNSLFNNEPEILINPPAGMTTAEFQDNLLTGATFYNGGTVNYDVSGGAGGGYNSNSFFTGILQANGINGQSILQSNFPSEWFPGANNPLPKSYFKGDNCE